MNEKEPHPELVETPHEAWVHGLTHEAIEMIFKQEDALERQAKLAANFPPEDLAIHNKLVEDLRQSYGDNPPIVDGI